jgi:putative membrane protein insertion efficiency factor
MPLHSPAFTLNMMEKENNRVDTNEDDAVEPDSTVPDSRPRRRMGCGRLALYILIFVIIENIIIPPRYQISNNMALGVIWVYQNTASKVFKSSGMIRCRFYPTCSEYGRLSLLHDGFLIGSGKALYRILRCNPFNKGPRENWPYEGAWDDCCQLPQPYLDLPDDVHLPPWAEEELDEPGDTDDGFT